jgi:hypothetical protein
MLLVAIPQHVPVAVTMYDMTGKQVWTARFAQETYLENSLINDS